MPSFARPPFTARGLRWLRAGFALFGALALMTPFEARADKVVVIPSGGSAPEEQRHHVEEALADAVRAVGHEASTERESLYTEGQPLPESANELRAVAEVQGASYTLVTLVEPAPDGYRLLVRVGYAPVGRVEELRVYVSNARESERLRDILQAMLRPAGIGDDALRLTAEEAPDRSASAAPTETPAESPADADTEAETEAEAEARAEFLERERKRREAEAAAAEARWQARERYGQRGGTFLLGASFGPRFIVVHEDAAAGGALGEIDVFAGYALSGLPGLELRGGLGIAFGAATALSLDVGAVYLASFFEGTPLFLGGGISVGAFQALTGSEATFFRARAAIVAAYRLGESAQVEVQLPELALLGGETMALTLGATVGIGLRF